MPHVCVLLLLVMSGLAWSADTPAGGKPKPPPAPPKILKLQALDLWAQGKAAVTKAGSANPAGNPALVEAAVAFETARRLVVADPDPDLQQKIQADLFWCKKQMNGNGIKAFTAAVSSLPAHFTAVKIKPVKTPLPDQESWHKRLQQQVREALTARKSFTLGVDPAFVPPKVTALAEDGTLTVRFPTGDPETRDWKDLSAPDLAGLALATLQPEAVENHQVAAYFLYLASDGAGYAYQLHLARDKAGEVEKALGR